ncbi:H-X9-DG-CTERM domain-containing protein [uncultured Phenylobacterium sp.]|uniref:H-X9-DG-CTERM domain-containing protein n=1 Tax=uncultured Phenylobacterium sp. TaxID=349273 RepID=UPI0025DA791D|nr:H-X9-DG-CTERM domain-containing protein [uncultured Phenylobacterium sp.]
MSTDKKPEDQITDAGAVELEETQLDDAAGGIIAIAPALNKYNTLEQKVLGDGSVRPSGINVALGDGSVRG